MKHKLVGRGGVLCSVQITPPGPGSETALSMSDRDRDGGATHEQTWTTAALRAGVHWRLEAGHSYTLQFVLPPDADSLVRVDMTADGPPQTVFAKPLRGKDQSVTIITAGSAFGFERTSGTLGRGSGDTIARPRPTARAKPPQRPPESPLEAERRKSHFEAERPKSHFEAARPKTPARDAEPVSRSLVSTGFAPQQDAASPADPGRPLQLGEKYFFWFQIGDERVAGAIDRETSDVNVAGLEVGSKIEVALFAFEDEIGLYDGFDVGVLEVHGEPDARGERAVRVARPVAKPNEPSVAPLLDKRLFFPVRLPEAPGVYHLRCNVYYCQVLVQSRLVTAEVSQSPSALSPRPLETVLDYKISEAFRRELFDDVSPHILSVMLNDNGNGTHGFRFFGKGDSEPFKNDLSIGETDLKARITNVRQQLRQVSWGATEEWASPQPYRYENARPISDLRADLIRLARAGFRLYDHLASRLANAAGTDDAVTRVKARRTLEAAMRKTGRVQIAAKASANLVVPAALFYDYPFADGDSDTTKFRLCPVFEEALAKKTPISDTVCFHGACPTAADKYVVCPSGFWGFRHALGFPTIEKLDAAFTIPYSDAPRLLVSVSTDAGFVRRAPHETALRTLVGDAAWRYADDITPTFDAMRKDDAQVVYFYCHGGRNKDESPYIEVGPSGNKQVITKGELSNERVLWETHPPLVFINGCHTTAVDPEAASDLVSGFREINAVGVIGTEITIFEPLACTFAERTLAHFFGGAEIGESVRRARLDVLQTGNPLGLVYIPFVLASVGLRKVS